MEYLFPDLLGDRFEAQTLLSFNYSNLVILTIGLKGFLCCFSCTQISHYV